MAEEVEKCSLSKKLFFQNSPNIKKEEFEEDGYMEVCETSIIMNDTKNHVWEDDIKKYKVAGTVDDIKVGFISSEASNILINDTVKIEKEISADDIKFEFNNKLLFCDRCNNHYEDYCTKCGMLAHILNGIAPSITNDKAKQEIPNGILEIRESYGHVGIFALKVIPESVKMGPFSGLSALECPWRLKGGKFTVCEDISKLLNWMQHINPAKNIFQQNLIPFQHEDKLYYHSNREILPGEELLVYFGEEYEDSVSKDIEMDFIPSTEDYLKEVYACMFCSLGFSSKEYLTKHKSICPSKTNEKFSIEDLTQCPFCKIFLDEKEYHERHKPYCWDVERCIPLALDNQTVEVNRSETRRLNWYKCTQCQYKTAHRYYLKRHTKTKHPREFSYECEICNYKTNKKANLEIHVKTKHIKEFKYKCNMCDCKTNSKTYLENHIKTKHLKEFCYECEICDYKTNGRSVLVKHTKTKHLKEFSYECDICDHKTNEKSAFVKHTKTKHLKEFNYRCEICNYKTNEKSAFIKHTKTKHLKEFSYVCVICAFKTNEKSKLKNHMKTKHQKEFSYECGMCGYKTNIKTNLEIHIKTKHLKEFSYDCEICDYKTNVKSNFAKHVKTKHMK